MCNVMALAIFRSLTTKANYSAHNSEGSLVSWAILLNLITLKQYVPSCDQVVCSNFGELAFYSKVTWVLIYY